MRPADLIAVLLLCGVTSVRAQEDPPLHPRDGGVASPEPRRPTSIGEARIAAARSRVDGERTQACLVEIAAFVERGDRLRHAADYTELIGVEAVELLLRIANTTDSERVRADAYLTLWEVTPRVMRSPLGRQALADMLDWLEAAPDDEDKIASVSAGFRGAIDSAGPAAIPLLPRLADLASHPRGSVRHCAVRSIARLGRFGRSQTRVLLDALDDEDPRTRIAALHGLAGRFDVSDDLLERLSALEQDRDEDVRKAASLMAHVQRLETRHRASRKGIPPRYPELPDGAQYWGPVFPEDAGPAGADDDAESPPSEGKPAPLPDDVLGLVAALDDPATAPAAEARLTAMGPRATAALPVLILHLDECDRTRAPAVRLLAAIGGDDPQVIEELVAVVEGLCRSHTLSHHSPEPLPAHAARALGRLGPRAAAALPALREARFATSRDLRESAEAAIAEIEQRSDDR